MAWRPDHVGRRDARSRAARVDYDVRERSEYIDSPANEIHDGATKVRENLERDPSLGRKHAVYDEMRAKGLSDYVAWPLYHTLGKRHIVTFATDRPGGFDDAHIAGLLKLLPALALVSEIRIKNRLARTLLETYVGSHAGELIGALARRELRDASRAMTSGQRAGHMAGPTRSVAFVDALLEFADDPWMAGVDVFNPNELEIFEAAKQQRLRDFHGAVLDTIAERESTEIEAAMVPAVARVDIQDASKLASKDFEAIARRIESKIDGPWLKRFTENGIEVIRVVDLENHAARIATPDEIRDGKFYKVHSRVSGRQGRIRRRHHIEKARWNAPRPGHFEPRHAAAAEPNTRRIRGAQRRGARAGAAGVRAAWRNEPRPGCLEQEAKIDRPPPAAFID
jgi:hypothetical protein